MWLFCIFFWVFIVLSMKSSHCLTKKNTAMKTKHSVGASPWGSWQHRAIFILFFFWGGHSKSLSNLSQHYSSGDVYKNMTLFIFFIFFHVTSVLRLMTTHMVHVSHLKHSLCFFDRLRGILTAAFGAVDLCERMLHCRYRRSLISYAGVCKQRLILCAWWRKKWV